MKITDHFSPNCHARSSRVNSLVLHYTDMLSADAAIELLCDPKTKVSSHYLIDKQGKIFRLVEEDKVAYHAGVSYWRGQEGLNESSIGIEIDNYGHAFGPEPFPQLQIKGLVELLNDIRSRHSIKDTHIVAHSDIAPLRKKDPGELFPWAHLHQKGHGIWVPPKEQDLKSPSFGMVSGAMLMNTQKLLRKIGYDVPENGILDEKIKAIITAFQRHFLPMNITGELDFATEQHVQRVAEKF